MLGLVLALASLPMAASAQPAQPPQPALHPAPQPALHPALRAQLQDLIAEKASRSPAQRKVASRLLLAERLRRGEVLAPGLRLLRSEIEAAPDGTVLVDLSGEVTAALRSAIERLGGEVLLALPDREALRARIPLHRVSELAARPELRRVRPAEQAFTRKIDTSEGDGAHYADAARTAHGIDGSGVSVGVLSDGVDSLASLQSSGDLPGVTVLPGQGGSGTEGTAMLEIVFDLAPGATLLFATAFSGQASFANNIVALRNAGADVIVDDVGYHAEGAFQDDQIAQAVDQVVADGALYFSAAGNSGNLNDGTAGVYEADFVAGSLFAGAPAHDYGGGDIRNEITDDSPLVYTLQWSDELGGSGNDYDLYLVEAGGTQIVSFSTDVQNGNDDPFELVSSQGDDTGRHLIVVKDAGADRLIRLNSHRGELEHATAGQIWGHGAAEGALAVAAVDARSRASGFLGTEPVEDFSSDGPRRIFYEANGTPITPGDFSSTGGELRDAIDLAAADCVDTATPGFGTFCGTSAAAPHAAAVAALLLELGGGPGQFDPEIAVDAMRSTALDIEGVGPDRDSGDGILHAEDAADAMPLCSSSPECDDQLYCNGAEVCTGAVCDAGVPPACGGETPFCDEVSEACVECLGAGDCDDGVFCNGAETCVAGACQAGSPPSCTAPAPFCDENAEACAECLGDGDCDDSFFCTGAETCQAGICQDGPPPNCQAPTPFCDEILDVCGVCSGDPQCDDGLFCNGDETCGVVGACEAGAPPSCDPATPFCDEGADACAECLADGDCDDALFCSGVESCGGGACQPDPGPVCEAPTPVCDEAQDACVEPSIPALPGRPGGSAWWLLVALLGLSGVAAHACGRARSG